MKGMGCGKVYCLMVLMPMLVAGIAPMVRSQPFLNSLAVLFRSRPPWPTTFPSSSKFPGFPSSFLSSQHSGQGSHMQQQQQQHANSQSTSVTSSSSSTSGAQHGILVAQPIVNNYDGGNQGNGGSSVGDVKKNQESSGGGVYNRQPQASQQQNYVHQQVTSNPGLLPPVPVFPPPMNMFHNNHLVSTRVEAGGEQGGSSGGYNSGSGESGDVSSNGPKTLSDLPNLVASPSTLNGNVVFPVEPPTALSNPFFGMLYDHNMKPVKYPHLVGPQRPQKPKRHHGRKHKPGFRLNPWNPFPTHMLFNHLHHGNRENLLPNSSNEKEVLYEENKSEQLRKEKKLKDFRPSPQLSSFVETTVITDYASHMKGNNEGSQVSYHGSSSGSKEEKDSTKYTSFDGGDAKNGPKFESGFRPISFDQYAANYGTTATRPHYTNSQTQYFNPWSLPYDPAHGQRNLSSIEQHITSSTEGTGNGGSNGGAGRGDRKIVAGHVRGGGGGEKGSSIEGTEEQELSTSNEEYNPLVFFGNRGKIESNDFGQNKGKKEKSRHRFSSKGKHDNGVSATVSSTTASSELVEEWLPPGIRIEKKSDGRHKKFSAVTNTFNTQLKYPGSISPPKGVYKLPDKCEKFKKYGFCPVTRQYPLDAAERIATRCSALLSHLIAPLPKVDVQYEVGSDAGGNGSNSQDNKSGSWSWRSFEGKPICDTDEITTVPGWAKNENGDWMIILQTKLWQQKAHISLCSPVARSCEGSSCPKNTKPVGYQNLNSKLLKDYKTGSERLQETKCVQRFTAQRLAVFDPDNHDRCPVVRSVFLPSACVCLSKNVVMVNETTDENRSLGGKRGHSSSFQARQPLFSSLEDEGESEEKVNEEDSVKAEAEPSTLEQMSYPSHSKEALIEAQSSLISGMPRDKLPRFKVVRRKKSHGREEVKAVETPRPVFSKSPNATYMIISEKYSTNEASPELPIEGDTKMLENYGGNDAENDNAPAGGNGDNYEESDLDKETEEIFRSHPTIITSVKVNRH